MTITRDIVEGHTGTFDFQKRCCHYLIIQKNRKADHNSYKCIGHRRNIKCRICKKKRYIEPDCLMKVKTTQVIEKFIREKRNNEETLLTSPPSLKQQK